MQGLLIADFLLEGLIQAAFQGRIFPLHPHQVNITQPEAFQALADIMDALQAGGSQRDYQSLHFFQDRGPLQAQGEQGEEQQQGGGDDKMVAESGFLPHLQAPKSTIPSFRIWRLSRALPEPRTTVARGSSVILMGNPVS